MNELRVELRTVVSAGMGAGGPFPVQCLELVREEVGRHGGWLFREEIEGLWSSFPSAGEAFLAVLATAQAAQGLGFSLRFGLHLGDVTVTREGDVLGHALTVAKRLETAAPPNTAWLSSQVMERLGKETVGHEIVPLATLEFKGIGALSTFQLGLLPPGSARPDPVPEWARGGHPDWQAWRRRELLFCLVGPLGGGEELSGLLPVDTFYEAAEDREAELGRQGWVEEYHRWCHQLPAQPALTALLERLDPPMLAFFPDPRLGANRTLCLGGRPSEPILTERDLERLWPRLPRLLESWELALSSHTVIWVGPASLVDIFYREVRRRFPAGPEQPQWVLGATGYESLRWKRRGLQVYGESGSQGLLSVLEHFHQEDRTDLVACIPPVGDRPYKFLDSYQPKDRAIFFGRERESAVLYSWILTRPWLVLYGRSGVGKSSLLGAGVFPRLTQGQVQWWLVRCLHDPLEQLERRCREAWPAHLPPPSSLAQGLAVVAQGTSPGLVIVFEQFEEFFLRFPHSQRRGLARLLHELLNYPGSTGLHLLFSLREDFLAEMAELEEWVPTLLDSRFRLTALTREQARECIVGPAHLFHLSIQEELVETLLSELETEGVEPPELQIVMDRLYDQRLQDRLSLQRYRDLGGVRGILQGYLHDVLENQLAQGPWTPDLPRRVLRALVSPRGTLSNLNLRDLEGILQSGRPADTRGALQGVVKRLVSLRLIRSLQGSGHYELSHEYLIEEIQSWASEEDLAWRHAQMILQSEWESWDNLGSLISPERLRIVVAELPRLSPSSPELQLLVRGSMVHGVALGVPLGPESTSWLLELLDDPGDLNAYQIGVVQRRILLELVGRDLTEMGQERFLRAAEEYSNPTLLAELWDLAAHAQGPAFREAVQAATHRRFFGPQVMAQVPAGPAWLGATAELREQRKLQLPKYWHARVDSEGDLRQVYVEAFCIDITPVTNLHFAEFRPSHVDRYPAAESHHPAVCVSWYDAQAYATWLGKELVGEDMWEKAARGSDGRLFPWGAEFAPHRLNSQEGGLRSTTPVFRYPGGASPYGCLDMAGNVWEWTASSWNEEGPFKVQKGGSTLNPAPLQQASARMEAFPDFVLQWVGFRLMARGGDHGFA